MSLVSLAEEGNLPEFQDIDEETLNWIRKNKPAFQKNIFNLKKVNFAKRKAEAFLPETKWYIEKKCINSIHGIRHIIRVTAYVGYLIKGLNISGATANDCLVAASLHDIRRKNDKVDSRHGLRGAIWFLKNKDEVEKKFQLKLNKNDLDKIYSAIKFHEIPYELINKEDYQGNKMIIEILKTADALDRYRLPKLSWWINEKYLKLSPEEEKRLPPKRWNRFATCF